MKRRIEVINIYIIQIIRVLGIITLLVTNPVYPQNERYTNGAENGYTWISIWNPNLYFDDSKFNYLNAIIDRIRLEHKQLLEFGELV